MTLQLCILVPALLVLVALSLAPLFRHHESCNPPTGGHHDRRDSAGSGPKCPDPVIQTDERDEP